MSAARFCSACGAARVSEAQGFCTACGRAFSQPVSTPNSEIQGTRPVWLVSALTFLTAGFYFPIWAGLSWSAMKRQVGDPNMSPLGHGFAMLVPIYGIFRVHAHFQLLNALLGAAGSTRRLSVALGVGAYSMFALWGIVTSVARLEVDPGIALAVTLAAVSFVAGYGQSYLNDFYRANGTPHQTRVHAVEWLLLIAGLLAALFLFEYSSGRI